ncbi:unnamed protein product [Rotaria sordida]|uniref:Uncharacterized protein n=1 Tax=Rotaria sordida TaxID=392033 RepID=A0A815XQX5_9BILA|nr:unnamed protein product [Rotaria sordida]CAF1560606.1 unnamed protein product [Rotaria sordida]
MDRLTSLHVRSNSNVNDKIVLLQLNDFINKAPCLHSLIINNWNPSAIQDLPLHIISNSIRRLDLQSGRYLKHDRCLNSEQCAAFLRSSRTKQCEILEIVVNDQSMIDDLINGELSNSSFTRFTALLADKHPSLLKSLTISNCNLPMEHIESLLSQTLALIYLKLVSHQRTFDTVFDGYNWEQFILNKLSQLNQFEYFFSFTDKTNEYMKVLNHLLASFQTPFWLQKKRWFTTCSYVFESQMFELHTTTIKTLIILNLQKNHIGDIGAQHFREALQINKTLVKFTLKNNQSSLCAMVQMEHEIAHEMKSTIFDWTGHQIRNEQLEYLSTTLQTNYTTITLILDGNHIGDNGMKYLANGLLKNKTLQELSLRKNRIGDEGMKYIADVLKENITLTTLILSNNLIGDDGAKYLADAIQNNTQLTTLNLDNNRIGDDGAQHIATALNINTHSMKDEAVSFLAQSLMDNKTVVELNLSSNQIEENGAQHLANALRNNTILSLLNLNMNSIGYKGLQYLVDSLIINKTLTILKLRENKITDEGTYCLIDLLFNNNVRQSL